MSKILVICGKSASGKDTLQNYLVENYDFINLVSHTTRPPRPNEVKGRDYYFVCKDEFLRMEDKDMFIETREYMVNSENGSDIWYYGLSKSELDISKILNTVVILDLKGIAELAEYVGWDNMFVVYLQCNPDIRLNRMKSRGGMTEAEIDRRFNADDIDFKDIRSYSDLILNSDKNSTEELAKIVIGVVGIE